MLCFCRSWRYQAFTAFSVYHLTCVGWLCLVAVRRLAASSLWVYHCVVWFGIVGTSLFLATVCCLDCLLGCTISCFLDAAVLILPFSCNTTAYLSVTATAAPRWQVHLHDLCVASFDSCCDLAGCHTEKLESVCVGFMRRGV